MGINFFDPCCQTTTDAVEFGLCDDPPPPSNVPAYIDTISRNKWIAFVQNPNQISITFTAIDSCITIKRLNEEDSKRCDVMLIYGNKIIFVELKESNRNDSFNDGIGQLTETINFFSQNHAINQYIRKTAYVANKLKLNFQSGNSARINEFKNDTGFRLETKNTILIS